MPRGFPRLSSVKLSWVIAIGGLSLCTIATLTIILIVTPARSWAEWLFGFQTLVAGLLALWAAAFTVIAMVIIEIRSTHRHNELLTNAANAELANAGRHGELMVLNTRIDRLRMDRLAWLLRNAETGFPAFRKIIGDLATLLKKVEDRTSLMILEGEIDHMIASSAWLTSKIKDLPMATTDLFPGYLELSRDLFLSAHEECMYILQIERSIFDSRTGIANSEQTVRAIKFTILNLRICTDKLSQSLDEFLMEGGIGK